MIFLHFYGEYWAKNFFRKKFIFFLNFLEKRIPIYGCFCCGYEHKICFSPLHKLKKISPLSDSVNRPTPNPIETLKYFNESCCFNNFTHRLQYFFRRQQKSNEYNFLVQLFLSSPIQPLSTTNTFLIPLAAMRKT